jgi:hypothetical protein
VKRDGVKRDGVKRDGVKRDGARFGRVAAAPWRGASRARWRSEYGGFTHDAQLRV